MRHKVLALSEKSPHQRISKKFHPKFVSSLLCSMLLLKNLGTFYSTPTTSETTPTLSTSTSAATSLKIASSALFVTT